MAVNETVGINLVADTKSLRSQLREATQDFIKLQQSSTATASEINKAAKRAAELKERISDAKDTIAAFNPEAKFKAFGQVIQGVAGAFAATQGAMALLGVEGEEVQKTLLKVQGALALSEGLNTVLGLGDAFGNLSNRVKESSIFIGTNGAVTAITGKIFKVFGAEVATTSLAFRALKTAIISTGIGALVILLGEAVAMFDSYMNSAKDAAKAQEEFNKAVIKGAEAEREGVRDSLKRQEELELAKAKRKGASEAELFAIQDKFARLNIKAQERFALEIKGKGKEALEAEKDLKNLKAKRDTDLINNETTLILKSKEKQTKANQEALAQQEKDFEDFVAKNEKRISRLNELNKSGKSEFETKLIELKTQYDADLLLFSDNELAKLVAKKSYDEKVFQATKDEKERISKLEDKDAEDKIKKLDKERDKKIADDLKTKSMITKAMDKSIAITKEQAEAGVKIAEEESKAKIAAAQGTADTLAGLANLLGTETAAGKAAAVASATISAILSAQKAYESTIGIPFVGPVLAPINAGLALASGYKSIQSILAVQIPGQSGGGSAPGLPSGPDAGAGAPIAPRAAEPTATTLDSKSLNTISNVVSRAYVVESDITGSQQRISRIEKAARF
jgi:hypothetical protein